MKRKKERQSHMDIYLTVVSVLIVILTFLAFIDFGNRLHFFPLIFFLGAILNGILTVYNLKNKKKIFGIIFAVVAILLVILGLILHNQVWR